MNFHTSYTMEQRELPRGRNGCGIKVCQCANNIVWHDCSQLCTLKKSYGVGDFLAGGFMEAKWGVLCVEVRIPWVYKPYLFDARAISDKRGGEQIPSFYVLVRVLIIVSFLIAVAHGTSQYFIWVKLSMKEDTFGWNCWWMKTRFPFPDMVLFSVFHSLLGQ